MWNSFRGFPLAFLTILAFSATVQAPSVGLCQFPRISFPFIHSDTTEVTTKAGHRRSAPTVSQSSGRALFITYSPYASALTGEGCMTLRESWYHCQLSSTGLKMFGNSSFTSVTECMAVSCFGEKNNITITVYAFASYWTLFFVCVFLLQCRSWLLFSQCIPSLRTSSCLRAKQWILTFYFFWWYKRSNTLVSCPYVFAPMYSCPISYLRSSVRPPWLLLPPLY